MTHAQAAKRLGLKSSTIYTYVKQGRIQGIGPIGENKILAASVEAYAHKRNENLSRASKRNWSKHKAMTPAATRVNVVKPAMRDAVLQHTYILEGMLRAGASEAMLRRYLSEFRDQVLA
jgi:excisionase family DNA binding protein